MVPFFSNGVEERTVECEDEAPERPHVSPECNGAFETLRQLVAHQTHKHGQTPTWYRRSDQHVCMVSERLQGSTCDLLHHQQSWKRRYCTGRGCHLHTVVIPVNTTCSHCDEHFESVAMLLEHLRTEFPLDQRNAELGLDAGSGNAGGEATETEAPSRRTGAAEPRHTEADAANSFHSALKHDLEIRELQAATFRAMRVKYDEPLVQASKAATGRFVTKSKEG